MRLLSAPSPLCYLLVSLYMTVIKAATPTSSALSSDPTCYFPDGTNAESDRPCGNGHSACCAADALCLSNGLCLDSGPILARGSCTDRTWTDLTCPQQCVKSNHWIESCASDGTDVVLSCDTCAHSNFTIPIGQYILRDYQATRIGLPSATTLSTAPSAMSSVSAVSSTPTATGPITSVATGGVSNETNGTPEPVQTQCTGADLAQQSLVAQISDNQRKTATTGAAVGVPFGLLCLVFAGLFVLEKRKNIKLARKMAARGESSFAWKNTSEQMCVQEQGYGRFQAEDDRGGFELSGRGSIPSELASSKGPLDR